MKTTRSYARLTAMLAALALAPACAATDTGGDDDDDVLPDTAYLTIVGDRDVFLENGWTYRLSVRYHDAAGEPLAGRVDFRIVGPAAGASLLDDGGVTNGDGLVAVDLVAGAQGEAVFTVEATAANAEPAIWNIAVSEGVPPLPPLDVTGTYDVDNHFDIVSGLPGTAGDIVNTFIELTDDPYDPATFLLDKLQDEIDSGVINDLVDAARPALDGFLNDLIRSYSPDFVSTLLDIGDKLGQVTRNLGLESTLKIEIVGGVEGDDLSATHTVRGVTFRIDGVEYAYSMADLSMDDITVEGVGVRMDGETKVYIDEHSFPVSYGAIAMLALDEVIIPLVDSSATNLQELLSHLVDCYTVGVEIANYIGVGSPGLYEGACELGIAAAASEIENQIRSIDDAGIVLTIHGDAKPQDTNTDRKVDVLLNGRWEGTISYAGTDAALSRDDNTFRGERMPVP